MLTKRGMYLIGTKRKLMKSTKGQYPTPDNHTPGNSVLIFLAQFPSVKSPDCMSAVAKNTDVNVGPKMSCPNMAFCNVEKSDVLGSNLKIISYQACAAGPK